MKVVIYEDNEHAFYPLIALYPQFYLRVGMKTVAESTAYYFPQAHWDYIGRDIFRFRKVRPETPTCYISGRVILTEKIVIPRDDVKFLIKQKIVGFIKQRPPFPKSTKDIHDIARTIRKTKRVSGFVLDNLWDLIRYNEPIVHHHFSMKESRGRMLKGLTIIGNKRNIYIAANALVQKQVALDVTDGPIYIDKGAVIRPFTTIIGPSYIGPGTIVERAKVTKSSIGPLCRIGGEVEASIFQGYSNKYHEGFIGHSFVGEWVNLGALTTNSDLKNNYGSVRIMLGKKAVDTGMMKLGCFIGDHTKTGIGTFIPTGAVVGSFVNFFGGGTMPLFVRSFRWLTTERQEDYDLEKAIATAKIVMKRRNIRMSKKYEDLIRTSHRWRNVL